MKTGLCDRDDEPNNNLRCTQTEEKLTTLGPIHSHYHAAIDVDTVCKLFLQKHPRRMEAVSLLLLIDFMYVQWTCYTGVLFHINGLHVLYKIVYSCTLSWLNNSIRTYNIKMPKIQWEFFPQCNPPFQTPAYGPGLVTRERSSSPQCEREVTKCTCPQTTRLQELSFSC